MNPCSFCDRCSETALPLPARTVYTRARAIGRWRAVKAPDQAKAFLMRHADCHHCFLTRAPGKLCLSMSITEPRANSSAPTTAGDRM
jgi:hypothetical protein